MTWLPYERVTLATTLSPEAARARIAAQIMPTLWVADADDPRSYRGWWRGDWFKAQRRTALWSGTMPVIRGEIQSAATGSTVTLRLRLPFRGLAFSAWLTLAAVVLSVAAAALTIALSLLVLLGWGSALAVLWGLWRGKALREIAFLRELLCAE